MELSTEIKQARQKLGLSQSQAAKAWEVPLRTLQAWEQRTNAPRGFALKHLRGILDTVLRADESVSQPAVTPAAPSPTDSRTGNSPPKG